jgi:hypothetical protein
MANASTMVASSHTDSAVSRTVPHGISSVYQGRHAFGQVCAVPCSRASGLGHQEITVVERPGMAVPRRLLAARRPVSGH